MSDENVILRLLSEEQNTMSKVSDFAHRRLSSVESARTTTRVKHNDSGIWEGEMEADGTYAYDGNPDLFWKEWAGTASQLVEQELNNRLSRSLYSELSVFPDDETYGSFKGCQLRVAFFAKKGKDFTPSRLRRLLSQTCESLEEILPKINPTSLDFYVQISFRSEGYSGLDETYTYGAGRFFDDSFEIKDVPTDAKTLQAFIDKIGITKQREAKKDTCINESAFSSDLRCKSCDFWANTGEQAYFRWYTVGDADEEEDTYGVRNELVRCLTAAVKEFKYETPFKIYALVESCKGVYYGSYEYDITFDGKTVSGY